MGLTSKDFAILKKIEGEIITLENFLRSIDDYPYLVMSKRKVKDCSFWDTNKATFPKNRGFPQITDLPDDIYVRETVVALLRDKLKQLKKEYGNYIKED